MARFRYLTTAAAGLVILSGPAAAQSVTWNLASPASSGSPNNRCVLSAQNAAGNAAICNANDPSNQLLTVTAYSFSASTGNRNNILITRGNLNNQGSSGLGLCNSGEGTGCSGSPNHAIDNSGFSDFILLHTAPGIALNSVRFGWTSGDADFTVLRFVGAGNPMAALANNTSMQSFLSGGWSVVSSVDGAGSGTYAGFNPSNLASTHWIIASYNFALVNGDPAAKCPKSGWGKAFDCGDDAFKINRVTGTVVPEPSTYALMAAGLAGIFGVARRRRSA